MKRVFAIYLVLMSMAQIGYSQATASFTSSQTCDGAPMVFTSTANATVGTIVTYEWDFDDNGVVDATGQTAQLVFPGAGVYNVRHSVITDGNFVATIVTPVTVHPIPVSDFSFSGGCVGDTVSFMQQATISSGFIQSYAWDFNGSLNFQGANTPNSQFFFPGSGFYRVGLRATSNEGCVKDTFQVVQLTNKPNAAFDWTDVCFGNPTNFTNNSNVSTSVLTYQWSLGDGTITNDKEPVHTYSSFGEYTVELLATSAPGCNDTVTRTISVFAQPTADIGGTDVCLGDETEFTNNSQPNGGKFESFSWFFGDGNTTKNLNHNQMYSYSDTGKYDVILAVKTIRGCVDTSTTTVTVSRIPQHPIMANGSIEFCEGGSVSLIVDKLPDANVLWSTGSGDSLINVSSSGNYSVLLFTQAGCRYRDTMEVIVNKPSDLLTSSDTTINNGDRIELRVRGAAFYEWSGDASLTNANSDQPSVSPAANQTYSVRATNEFGCISEADVVVTVFDDFGIKPYNLFTPDGNGQNDFWVIQNIDRYPQCEVSVYDSWGREIFSQTNYLNNWDGKLNGQDLSEGTYYYRIACPNLNQDFNGFVNLLRINK